MTSIRYLFLLIFFNLSVFICFGQQKSKTEFNVGFHNFANVNVKLGYDGFATFTGTDLHYVSLPGDPDIPYKHFQVLLPANCDMKSLRLDISNIQWRNLPEKYNVKPAPPSATRIDDTVIIVYPEQQNIVDGKNIDVYKKDSFFPEPIYLKIQTGQKGAYKIASFNIPCYRFNPVRKILQKIDKGNFYLEYKILKKTKEKSLDFYPDLPEDILMTRKAFESYSADSRSNSRADAGYVILTTNSIDSASEKLDEFINAKENMGYAVTVVTESEWGGGSGDEAAENIHSWLEDNYDSLNIEYLLLIGDPDPDDGDVPMKMLWPRHNYSSYKEAPSDYYYSDMTGDWDLDGDGYYGEWSDDTGDGGCDKYYEFIVGRIPYYGDINDLDAILTKLICFTYEPASQCSWRENVILPMEPSDEDTPGYHLGEAINDDFVIPKSGWNSHRVYEEDYGLDPPPETYPCTYSNVYDAWIDDHPSVALWWTHGNYNIAADVMNISNAALLNDSLPAFTFQCSCLNAYPESSGNLAYALLKNGSPGANAATRVSWYYVGQTNFNNTASNSGMTYEYAERLIGDEKNTGYSLFDLKQDLYYGSSAIWMNYCVFNLYGDPSLSLFTPCPDTMFLYDAEVEDDSWRFYSSSSNIVFAYDTNTYIVKGTGSSGARVTATSDSSIIFKPGFHAETGSDLHAWIGDGCTASMVQTTPYNFLENIEITTDQHVWDIPDDTYEITVYPNPTKDAFTVDFIKKTLSGQIAIFNFQGNELLKIQFKNKSNLQINISHLPDGIYFLNIITPELVLTKRIIKLSY